MALDLIKPSEAAEMLGVQMRTLQDWRYTRRGPPYFNLGNRLVRYDRTDVQEWMAANPRSTSEGHVPANLADLDLMKPSEVSQVLGVKVATLTLWRKARRGPPYYQLATKMVRYDRKELESWLASRVSDPAQSGSGATRSA